MKKKKCPRCNTELIKSLYWADQWDCPGCWLVFQVKPAGDRPTKNGESQ